MQVSYSYLKRQFSPDGELSKGILADIQRELYECQFTLGPWVDRFETAFAQATGAKHAIGVSNGTDAIVLALKACGMKQGDAAITPPNSFLATTGAILQAGGQPVFVDVGPSYLLDWQKVPSATVSKQASFSVPVDLTGNPVPLAKHWQPIPPVIIRDACQAVGASYDGQPLTRGVAAACYSLHPLKNVNVWGDGGVVCTDHDEVAQLVRLLRNHGLQNRDTCVMPGYNHRLASLQAIVGWHALRELDELTSHRIAMAARYDEGLRDVPGICIPPRDPKAKQVYHTYVIQADRRDDLQAYLTTVGVETKIHYPRPIHVQPGFAHLGYHEGDFPMTEAQAKRIISLPIHQYLTEDEVDYVIDRIREYCGRNCR